MSIEMNDIKKALEAGSNNVAGGSRVQGAALQAEENLSKALEMVCIEEDQIQLQKWMEVVGTDTATVYFRRQLSVGRIGGSARREGQIGRQSTSDYTQHSVAMAFYSDYRVTTVAMAKVKAFDSEDAQERQARDAALKIAIDVEFDLFKGQSDFSNAGVFDGNPLAVADSPNMQGLDIQIRQADLLRNNRDLMFSNYGAGGSNVVAVGGAIGQNTIEDLALRTRLNHGKAKDLFVSWTSKSQYNRLTQGKERIILANAPQAATGADLKKQWVSTGGEIEVIGSEFLEGKVAPNYVPGGLAAPTGSAAAASSGSNMDAGDYIYNVSACNDEGESALSADITVTVADGEHVTVTITPPGAGVVRYFEVYRTAADGASGSSKFIGRVKAAASGNTSFVDSGNKLPGFSTGFLLQKDSMKIAELAPFSRLKSAMVDLSYPEMFFRFATLCVMKPRVNVLAENCL